jgi:uncharacterized protein YbjT (DUF2867 family)
MRCWTRIASRCARWFVIRSARVIWAQRGVDLVVGDLLDARSLANAFSGADVVFGVTQPWKPGARKADAAEEVIQGKNIVDACKKVEAILVLSTQLHGGEEPTGIPHADSKLEIEAHARGQRVRMVNVRPSFFLDNIGSEWFPVTKGKVQGLIDVDAKLPSVASRDIGRAVAAVIERLPEHVGKHLNLVTGMYSGEDICAALSRLRGGGKFRYGTHPRLVMRWFFKEFYLMRVNFEKNGRPPFPSDYTTGLETTVKLLNGSFWTLEDHLRERGYATRDL